MTGRAPRSSGGYVPSPERASDKSQQLSGKNYISVADRDIEARASDVRRYDRNRVPYDRDPSRCNHGDTMCASWECIEGWATDHYVMLWRTEGGRDLAARLDIDPRFDIREGFDAWVPGYHINRPQPNSPTD